MYFCLSHFLIWVVVSSRVSVIMVNNATSIRMGLEYVWSLFDSFSPFVPCQIHHREVVPPTLNPCVPSQVELKAVGALGEWKTVEDLERSFELSKQKDKRAAKGVPVPGQWEAEMLRPEISQDSVTEYMKYREMTKAEGKKAAVSSVKEVSTKEENPSVGWDGNGVGLSSIGRRFLSSQSDQCQVPDLRSPCHSVFKKELMTAGVRK